ncbi:MAG TPA: histidine kinase dimerization/phospho-acceptor domain-containing protein [Devosia sp.]|nr:histidine kinase dimerization/phospho-acceptor domain-containing protein [Devosia sp.]
MNADWTTSPSARRVLQHADDTRPAWLWSSDGQRLIWHNGAAELFLAKIKKFGLKRAPMAKPIKGQIARNIRLGSPGRTSLARIQFLAGEKPASTTCATTPLVFTEEQIALLIVGVDPIAAEILEAAGDEAVPAPEQWSEEIAAPRLPSYGDFESHAYERELESWREADGQESLATEQLTGAEPPTNDADDELPVGPEPSVDIGPAATQPKPTPIEPQPEAPRAEVGGASRLSQLVERLAAGDAFYGPLTQSEDEVATAGTEPQDVASPAEEPELPAPLESAQLYKVIGRGFLPDTVADTRPAAATPEEEPDGKTSPLEVGGIEATEPERSSNELTTAGADTETVERVSRYNFDELSRILTDRVGNVAQPSRAIAEAQRAGSLVNLGGETLVLNRLPLGILVFRDQQVLFANRAITEMVGYDSVENLRQAGLAAVFPAAGPEGQEAGPVNHLVQRDGTLVPVTARLQSISWQGRPALMLSASTTEVRTSHEAAVRAFAQALATVRGDGFFETTRSGVVSAVSPEASSLLASTLAEGKPLSGAIASDDLPALREFLERPARFAETARPALTVRSAEGKAELYLFAQGQAGVTTGYFGLVRAQQPSQLRLTGSTEADPALLARISRGVRRPLNTIIGYSDLIRSKASSALENERYASYADDITTAGLEIAALVDELDDYARLRDGRYLPQRASVELTALLESCVLRIRPQANTARVIVRNAISETLPRITADRASLAQAVLNLLASAIDQTPTGGAVVISAQRQDDGGIAIHVRDSSSSAVDMAERFVVFRDGVDRNGRAIVPVRSSVGLSLTRALLAVNTFSLSVNPAGAQGMLFTLVIPSDLVESEAQPGVAE